MQEARPSWFAVYTKPRQEHIALANLERQDYRCFLPMAINPYQRRTTKSVRIEPLFPRYLFLNAIPNQQSLAPVRSTRGVISLVRFGQRLARVPDAVVQVVEKRRAPDTGLIRLDPVPAKVGERVRVFDGPFAGFEGIFKERKGTDRALLLVSLLGTDSTVEVESLLLQKAV